MVDASRQYVDQEGVLFGRAKAQLRRAAEEERANIHRRPGVVWRDILGIQAYSQMNTVLEMLDRRFRNRDKGGRVLEPFGVLLAAEDVDLLVRGISESFETFVALLAVVQSGSHAMEPEIWIFDKFGRRPFACLLAVGGFDVAVDFANAEADVVPV